MPDPRLRTILEGQLTDIETNADAWNLPPSEFDMPPVEPPSTPSSPYECHSPSPLTHTVTDVEASSAKTCTANPSICGPQCTLPCAGSKRYPPEHSLHHWRRWSVSAVQKEVVVNLEEVLPSPDEHAGMSSCFETIHVLCHRPHPLLVSTVRRLPTIMAPVTLHIPPTPPISSHPSTPYQPISHPLPQS